MWWWIVWEWSSCGGWTQYSFNLEFDVIIVPYIHFIHHIKQYKHTVQPNRLFGHTADGSDCTSIVFALKEKREERNAYAVHSKLTFNVWFVLIQPLNRPWKGRTETDATDASSVNCARQPSIINSDSIRNFLYNLKKIIILRFSIILLASIDFIWTFVSTNFLSWWNQTELRLRKEPTAPARRKFATPASIVMSWIGNLGTREPSQGRLC